MIEVRRISEINVSSRGREKVSFFSGSSENKQRSSMIKLGEKGNEAGKSFVFLLWQWCYLCVRHKSPCSFSPLYLMSRLARRPWWCWLGDSQRMCTIYCCFLPPSSSMAAMAASMLDGGVRAYMLFSARNEWHTSAISSLPHRVILTRQRRHTYTYIHTYNEGDLPAVSLSLCFSCAQVITSYTHTHG